MTNIMDQILTAALRLTVTVILSGILGYEREKRNQAAGFRTYIIVSSASALVMMMNQFIFSTMNTGDPVRMGAQVISGIGFLGAGAILVTRNQQIRGLTTAAGLWAAAIIGMSIGAGYYAGGIVCSLFIFVCLRFLTAIDRKIGKNPPVLVLYFELSSRRDLGNVIRYVHAHKYHISDMKTDPLSDDGSGDITVTFMLHTDGRADTDELLRELESIPGVNFAAPI